MMPLAEIDWAGLWWTLVRKVLNHFGFLLAMAVLLALSPAFARRIGRRKDAATPDEEDRGTRDDGSDP